MQVFGFIKGNSFWVKPFAWHFPPVKVSQIMKFFLLTKINICKSYLKFKNAMKHFLYIFFFLLYILFIFCTSVKVKDCFWAQMTAFLGTTLMPILVSRKFWYLIYQPILYIYMSAECGYKLLVTKICNGGRISHISHQTSEHWTAHISLISSNRSRHRWRCGRPRAVQEEHPPVKRIYIYMYIDWMLLSNTCDKDM